METKPAEILFLYQCRRSKHRVYRATQGSTSRCSRCSSEMQLVAAVPREEGESVESWRIRTLDFKKPS